MRRRHQSTGPRTRYSEAIQIPVFGHQDIGICNWFFSKGEQLAHMRIVEPHVERRTVIEAYVAYDCSKKRRPQPTLNEWDWTSANSIDARLRESELKCGVLAGYTKWAKVELTIEDIRQCAVVVGILKGTSRVLGNICEAALREWEPDRTTAWYKAICSCGQSLGPSEPLILRPAVKCEQPAEWYIEDGSGRAVALLKRASSFPSDIAVATAYLGLVPDRHSEFMRRELNELLQQEFRGRGVP
jgi:hypothetical protein